MNAVSVAMREGVRLFRASSVRTLVVVLPIAVATVAGMWSPEVAAACAPFSFAVLAVARRSPRPERLEQMHAWRRVGAGRTVMWLAGTVEALLLGSVAMLGGTAFAVAPLVAGSEADWRLGYLAIQAGLLVVAALLPTRRHTRRVRVRRVRAGTSGVLRFAIAAGAVGGAFAIAAASTIDTSIELAVAGFLVVVLLTIAGLVVSGLAPERVVDTLAWLGHVTPLSAISERRRAPLTVRLVIVVAIALVASTSILGASVAARPETEQLVDAELARLPVLPANVALISFDTPLSSFLAYGLRESQSESTKELTPAVRRAADTAVAGSHIIPVYHVDEKGCLFACENPHVVADPRFREIYGDGPTFSVDEPIIAGSGGRFDMNISTRVPPYSSLLALLLVEGQPLPRYSFAGAAFSEIALQDAAVLGTPRVRSFFVVAPRALSDVEWVRLAKIATDTGATLIGPTGQIAPYEAPPSFGGDHSLREQPWAITDAAARWSSALAATVAALAALFTTLAIDTIDRRREVRRLERLGATPGQVRGAAALRSGALFLVVSWTVVSITALLVRTAVRAYTERSPATPIPFVVPWALVAFLALGLPLVAAGLAALVARPVWAGTVVRETTA